MLEALGMAFIVVAFAVAATGLTNLVIHFSNQADTIKSLVSKINQLNDRTYEIERTMLNAKTMDYLAEQQRKTKK